MWWAGHMRMGDNRLHKQLYRCSEGYSECMTHECAILRGIVIELCKVEPPYYVRV